MLNMKPLEKKRVRQQLYNRNLLREPEKPCEPPPPPRPRTQAEAQKQGEHARLRTAARARTVPARASPL